MSVQLGLTTSEAGSLSRAVAEFVRLGQREPSGPMAQLKAVHYPDGRIGYPELGILCGAGETLAQALEQAGLTYVFMGDVLGGRPADPSLYEATEEGETPSSIQPDYERMAATPTFQAGIRRLLTMAHSTTVAMMCSEGDFRRCHRALLITPSLLEQGARVIHIHPDGKASEAQPEPKQLALL